MESERKKGIPVARVAVESLSFENFMVSMGRVKISEIRAYNFSLRRRIKEKIWRRKVVPKLRLSMMISSLYIYIYILKVKRIKRNRKKNR